MASNSRWRRCNVALSFSLVLLIGLCADAGGASILRPGPAAPLDCSIQACDTWPGGPTCIVLVVGGTVGGGIAVSAQQCVPPPDVGLCF